MQKHETSRASVADALVEIIAERTFHVADISVSGDTVRVHCICCNERTKLIKSEVLSGIVMWALCEDAKFIMGTARHAANALGHGKLLVHYDVALDHFRIECERCKLEALVLADSQIISGDQIIGALVNGRCPITPTA